MRDRRLQRWLVAVLVAILIPWEAYSAGLGRLTVNSGLGQPLNAEIELLSVKRGEAITARLAAPEVYNQANAQFNPALTGTRITVEKRANGDLYLRATTPRPIQEPFLELIVELNSESGRVTRQYTALLDPPGYGKGAGEIPAPAGAPAAPVAAAPESPTEKPAAAAKPAAPPKEAAVRPPSTAPERAGPAAGAGQYGPIKAGETLGGIARAVKPEGATVEQTLVALHRHNPDAFIRKNMNLVRSGKILKVPEASEISALPQPEAVREVRLQVQDFNAFRDRVAERAPSAAEEGSATRGRIGSVVTDTPASEPRDTVRISKGEPPGRPAASAKGSAEERIRALEEEAVSRQRALAEAGERIGQLEKIIKDMQRLAELRTPGAAPAQKAAEPPVAKSGVDLKSSASVSGTIAPPRVEQSKAASGGSASSSAPEAPSSPDASGAASKDAAGGPIASLPKTAPKPVPEPESSRGFMGDLLGQPLVLGLAAAVLLLSLLWLALRRRRARGGSRPDDDKIPPTFTSRSVVPPAAGGASASAKAATAAAPPPRIPDALGTAAPGTPVQPAAPIRSRNPATDNDLDFDLAPGSPTPSRPVPVALDTKPSAAASEPKKADAAAAVTPAPPVAVSPSVVPEPAKPPVSTAAPAVPPGAASTVAPAVALGAASTASQAATPSTDRPASGPGTRGPGEGTDAPLGAPAPSARSDATPPKASSLIDFDLDTVSPERRTLDAMSSERVSSEPPPRDFDFKLDLDNLDLAAPGEAKPAAPPKDAHWYDVQQKFDLAKAYEEMGDRNGARDILREVLKEGDPEQRVQATQLLAKLG